MKKKFQIVFCTILIVVLGSLIFIPSVQAENIVNQKWQTATSNLSSKSKEEVAQNKDSLEKLSEQLSRMDQAILDRTTHRI